MSGMSDLARIADALEDLARALRSLANEEPDVASTQSAQPVETRQVLDLEETAALLHVSASTVRRRIDDGSLGATRVARGRWIIRRSDIDAYLDDVAARPSARQTPRARPAIPGRGTRPAGRTASPRGRLVITPDMGRDR